MKKRTEFTVWAAWIISLIGVLPGILVWYGGPHGNLDNLSGYNLFPLLGLTAFGLMWSHYIVGALRLVLGVEKEAIKTWRIVTGWMVLAAIILHPGILIFNLWRDGFGLPPNSYLEHYVAPGLKWAALLGVVSLLAFLAYESHRWFERKKWWWVVQRANDIAIILILIHGFKLGGDLQRGWFRLAWLVYAETFIAALVLTGYLKWRASKAVVG